MGVKMRGIWLFKMSSQKSFWLSRNDKKLQEMIPHSSSQVDNKQD